jgi:hypothetical protein
MGEFKSGRLVTPSMIRRNDDLRKADEPTGQPDYTIPARRIPTTTHLIPSNHKRTCQRFLSPRFFLTTISVKSCTYWMNTMILLARL